MLQDLSNALETWDIDNKNEKLPGLAEESYILGYRQDILKNLCRKNRREITTSEIFDLTYTDCHHNRFGQIMEKKLHLGMLVELIADSARYF